LVIEPFAEGRERKVPRRRERHKTESSYPPKRGKEDSRGERHWEERSKRMVVHLKGEKRLKNNREELGVHRI